MGQPTTVDKLRGLPWSISANVANAIFCQFTFFGSVFPLFLSELGFSKSKMGFLFSLMPFCGLIAPLIAPATLRFGYKNTYMTFWGIRKIVTALLLLTPWLLITFGPAVALLAISTITAVFALCRAIAETARVPWVQEFVPGSVQGKYTAMSNIFTSLAGFLSVLVAGYVLGQAHNLTSFMLLIAGGVFFGFICVWLTSFIPGGAPVVQPAGQKAQRNLGAALGDRNLLLYLGGVGLIVIATTPIGSFLPLFMREQVGLDAGSVVNLQLGSLLGGLITSYLWGWAADRYGSKPVMLIGLNLRVLTPILLLLLPQHSRWSLPMAQIIYFLMGMADMGWGIGSTRLLYVSVVPPEKKGDYLALYSAWVGIVGGLSQLAGGWALDAAHNLSGRWGPLTLDAYTPLFVVGVLLTAACNLFFRPLRADNRFGTRQFAGLFLRGNPFLAMGSLIRYQYARDEGTVVRRTEELGQAKSLMTVDELLEALHDPRFQVRFEAIISIARMPPDRRLVDALIEVLTGSELALSVIAAWALGRLGDPRASEPLRAALDLPYHSIQAHAARALGALGDSTVVPELMTRLATEEDKGLQMAYASALGKLGATQAVEMLLELFYTMPNPGARLELALCLARLVGDEHHFIQLLRQLRADSGTAAAQTLTAFLTIFRKKFTQMDIGANTVAGLDAQLVESADAFARNDPTHGEQVLVEVLYQLPPERFSPTAATILAECARRLPEFGPERSNYLLLALHTLHAGMVKG